MQGKLKGKVIIPAVDLNYTHSFKPDAVRYTDEELAKMASAQPAAPQVRDTAAMRRMREQAQRAPVRPGFIDPRLLAILKTMAKEEGAVAMITTS